MGRRLSDWKRQAQRALRAHEAGEWWNGKRWRAHGELPTAVEARAYRTAHDVLGEALEAMIGDGPIDGDARMRAIRRFERSAEANRTHSLSTAEEREADEIFKKARPYLRKKPFRNRRGFTNEPARRTAWAALARYVSWKLGKVVTANRLRHICRWRAET
jgi:hypothetical protein